MKSIKIITAAFAVLLLSPIVLYASKVNPATEVDFEALVRTGTAGSIEQVLKIGVVNLEEYPDALFWALYNPNPGVIRILTEHGANRHGWGSTPIHVAALNLSRSGSHEIEGIPRVQLSTFLELLDVGFDIDEPSSIGTPLHLLAFLHSRDAQFVRFVRFLIEQGADVNSRRADDGMTPLMNAAYNGTPEVIEILLVAGADINASLDITV